MEIKNEEKMMELLKMCMEGNPDVKVQVSIKMKKKKHKSPKNLEENGDMPVEDSSHARIVELEAENGELNKTIEQQNMEITELKEDCENAERTISDKEAEITELKDKNENLQFENADYKIAKKKLQPFEELISLYQKAKTINEFCPLSLDLESPLKFLFCVASEQAVGSLYEKLRYNYKAVSKKVSVAIELYNELVDFMCSINPKFAAIDELGEMDDEHHAEINQKHEGQIKTILMKGYQYSVSGTVEKKAFVEVI